MTTNTITNVERSAQGLYYQAEADDTGGHDGRAAGPTRRRTAVVVGTRGSREKSSWFSPGRRRFGAAAPWSTP